MIILTNPEIKFVTEPVRISSTACYGGTKYCLAEIKDEIFLPCNDEDLEKSPIDFWWEIDGSIYASIGDYRRSYKFHGGVPEAVDWFIGFSKPENIAAYIAMYCRANNIDPFVIWERQLIKKEKSKGPFVREDV